MCSRCSEENNKYNMFSRNNCSKSLYLHFHLNSPFISCSVSAEKNAVSPIALLFSASLPRGCLREVVCRHILAGKDWESLVLCILNVLVFISLCACLQLWFSIPEPFVSPPNITYTLPTGKQTLWFQELGHYYTTGRNLL